MNTIENLYYGNISPQERTLSKEYRSVMNKVGDYQVKVSKELPETAQALFKDYIFSQMELNCLSEVDMFTIGFRLGTRLIIDVYTVHDGVIDDVNK